MTRGLRRFFFGPRSEGGQAIVLIAITMLGMLMIVGVAIDAGQLYSARRAMQEAADAAAYAGSVTLYLGGTQAQAFSAATTDATTNGFSNGVNGTTVTVQQPTASPYNTPSFVEVIISQSVRTSLVPAEAGITQVTVHAISGAESLNNAYAIMALDRNATADAFEAMGATLNITGGGILVNSTATSAADSTGSTWNMSCPSTNPCYIDVAGTTSGTFPPAAPGPPRYFNGVRIGQPQVADPFAGYPKPSTLGLSTNPAGFGPGNNTLGQGIYTSIISGKKLCHGTYILKGGGLGGDIGTDTTSTDPATGQVCDGRVLIFNTNSTYPSAGGTCTGMDVTGNHDVTGLLPPSSGTYRGLLFYQDPACAAQMQLGSSAFDFTVSGTIYLPNAAFNISSGHPNISGGQIVAKTVNLGAATVTINFTASNSAQPVLPRLAK
ncbi:MAG TPA: pilus assembly protein TadG-related protein [Candidatus Limnocylindria bacterium]|nr:pilus assembly protein TadG-related protein [Candidatus Limnocylindria bacterium]